MNTYTVVVKSVSRVGGSVSDFSVRFGQILPNDKTVFKCRVSSLSINKANLADVVNVQADPALSMALTADLPFINYQSTSGNLYPIALINYDMTCQSHDFLVSNINQQTVRLRFLDLTDNIINPADLEESSIVLTFETLQ